MLSSMVLPTRRLIATAALLPLLTAATTIYECVDQQSGKRTYTHHGCPAPGDERSAYTPGKHGNFAIEAMSADDLARVVAIETSRLARQGRIRGRATPGISPDELCREARSTLKALRAKRRQGYALKDIQRLDALERDAKASRRDHC